ncbi:hypothetical protein EVAR_51391_1 [Eumeta japonica]|uniref:Peptidase aspartic putative domain-containing protein n=1 Tax=Eumeta variegata TaxID=151549 RepID=A0A4C1ZSI4_EUMVA|nr:hypothetical protein EVAR_51391_1 [Eumeta japonica]
MASSAELKISKILSTAVVRVRDGAGAWQTARVLIDSCSHDSFVTLRCARRLGLSMRRSNVSGVELFDQIYDGQRIAPGPGLPCALSSVFRWVITGQFKCDLPASNQTMYSLVTSTRNIDDTLKRFWDQEEPSHAYLSSPEDALCEEMYTKFTYREQDGRFVVPMMIKGDCSLGDSYCHSLNRFLNLEKRLARDSNLKTEYTQLMREYEDLGHMQPVGSAPTRDNAYVIPHHCTLCCTAR